jgi:hypothetical protein
MPLTDTSFPALPPGVVEALQKLAREEQRAADAKRRDLPTRLLRLLFRAHTDTISQKVVTTRRRLRTEDDSLVLDGGTLRPITVETSNAAQLAAKAALLLDCICAVQALQLYDPDLLVKLDNIAEAAGIETWKGDAHAE